MSDQNPIADILREGGEFWVIETENSHEPGGWRPVVRETERDKAKAELAAYRKNMPRGRVFRVKHVVVTPTLLEW